MDPQPTGKDRAVPVKKMALPPELSWIIQEYTKAVLRECPVPEEGDPPPALYSPRALYEFSARYFEEAGESARGRGSTLGEEVVMRLVRRVGVLELAGGDGGLPPVLPLAEVALQAEEVGMEEGDIDAITHLAVHTTKWALDEDEEGVPVAEDHVTANTPINVVHFCALALAKVPQARGISDEPVKNPTLRMVLSSLLRVFGDSFHAFRHALHCYAMLDPELPYTPLLQSLTPSTPLSLSSLTEACPELTRPVSAPSSLHSPHRYGSRPLTAPTDCDTSFAQPSSRAAW